MTTFKDIPIGQRFKIARSPRHEWVKLDPVPPNAVLGQSRYNAESATGGREQFGHSTKVLLPPYGDTTGTARQNKRLATLNAAAQSAGWETWRKFETAVANGKAQPPLK